MYMGQERALAALQQPLAHHDGRSVEEGKCTLTFQRSLLWMLQPLLQDTSGDKTSESVR